MIFRKTVENCSVEEERLEVPRKQVLGHIAGHERLMRLQRLQVAVALLGGDLEAHVQQLAQAGIEARVLRIMPQGSGELCGSPSGDFSGRGAGDVVFVGPPERSGFSPAEVDDLWKAAGRGARIVILGDEQKARAKRIEPLLTTLGIESVKIDEATTPTLAVATMEPVPTPVVIRDRARLHFTDKVGLVPLLLTPDNSENNVAAAYKRMGRGDVVVVGSASSLSNDGIGLAQSAAFALWLVGDRRVSFDERHHHSRGRAVVLRALLQGPGPLTAGLGLLLLVPLSLLSMTPRKGDAGTDDVNDVAAARGRVRSLAVLLHKEGGVASPPAAGPTCAPTFQTPAPWGRP